MNNPDLLKESPTGPAKNNGLDLTLEVEQMDGTEHIFGALSQPGLAAIPVEQREMYLPKGELQFGVEDFMDCATRAPINALEGQFTWLIKNKKLSAANAKWLQDNGYITPEGRVEFSDRYIAILSSTTRSGNSLIAPLRAICGSTTQYGLIPKSMFKRESTFTFDQYHDQSKLTQKMRDLGKEFHKRFTIAYDQVQSIHFAEAIKDDFVDVAAYAWLPPVNGVYPPSDKQMNHSFILYGLPKFQAFDNYEESPGDYTKNLSPNYIFFQWGYRVFISAEKKIVEPVVEVILTPLQKLLNWFNLFVNWLYNGQQGPMPPIPETNGAREVLRWGTQKRCWRSVRVLCDEMGLTWVQKNTLCATIYQESGFINFRADGTPLTHPNINKFGVTTSIDYGIVQCNTAAHIGPGKTFPSVAYVMNNPEKMIRWMIGIYKKTGKLTPWYGWYDPHTNTYPHKKWLPLTSKMWLLSER